MPARKMHARDPIAKRIAVYADALSRTEAEILAEAQRMFTSDEYVTEQPLRELLDRRMVLRLQLADLRDIEREQAAERA